MKWSTLNNFKKKAFKEQFQEKVVFTTTFSTLDIFLFDARFPLVQTTLQFHKVAKLHKMECTTLHSHNSIKKKKKKPTQNTVVLGKGGNK
jgi:hypothetical protein